MHMRVIWIARYIYGKMAKQSGTREGELHD